MHSQLKDSRLTLCIVMLWDRHANAILTLHNDLNSLADTCIYSFSKQGTHYIDYAPGISPDSDEVANDCHVDSEGAKEYLGALRDAEIWPSTIWARPTLSGGCGASVGNVVDKLHSFREPEYDDVDKCEFCEIIRIKFTEALDRMKETQKERLWGLCLDCYKAGGVSACECRYDHAKAQPAKAQQTQGQTSGLGIKGL